PPGKTHQARSEIWPVRFRCRKRPATREPTPSPVCCAEPGSSDRRRAPSLVKGRSAGRRISPARHPSRNRQKRATYSPTHGRAKCLNIEPPHRSSPSPDRTRPRAPPMAAEKHYAARSRSRCRPATTGGSPREISRIAERWIRAAADTSGSRPGRVEPPQMSFAAPSPRGQFGGGQARCLRDKRHVDEALHRRAEILLDPAQLVQLF